MCCPHDGRRGDAASIVVDNKDLWLSKVSPGREIALTVAAVLLTLFASAMLARNIAGLVETAWMEGRLVALAGQAVFLVIVLCLVYGGLVYQLARLGYMLRLRRHKPASRMELQKVYRGDEAKELTILLPSYKEESRVVRQSLLSAALQQYPRKSVVLLIDDSPAPDDAEDAALLERALDLPQVVEDQLREAAQPLGEALAGFEQRVSEAGFDAQRESALLAEAYRAAAGYLHHWAEREPITDHADRLFVDTCYLAPARELEAQAAGTGEAGLGVEQVLCEYRRLASMFEATVSSFQRKRYANLSHEPNKAMNLNCYLSLMGGRFQTVERGGEQRLEPVEGPGTADGPLLCVPSTEFVLTLDADSILHHDYALRLIHHLTLPGNERLAIIQTPYTAVPDPPGTLERIAGATTDMQYIVHQGFTHFGATFWVGANAMLRRRALDDIAELDSDDGVTIKRYIADRTVIEDTESSIDLLTKGWQLYNYPQRLSYSATPPDFGSLLIQRRRWANGGLIILPKFLRQLVARPMRALGRAPEAFFRIHYLASIAMVNVAVPVLLIVPFEQNLRNIWLPLTAAGYFGLYGRDLVQAGYRLSDLLRVYALNLMLIPVNLAGVIKSIHQGWTGGRIAFSRTPKVLGRTPAPRFFTACVGAFAAYCMLGMTMDLIYGRYLHAAFAGINGGFFIYAMVGLIGVSLWPSILSRRAWDEPVAVQAPDEPIAGRPAESI